MPVTSSDNDSLDHAIADCHQALRMLDGPEMQAFPPHIRKFALVIPLFVLGGLLAKKDKAGEWYRESDECYREAERLFTLFRTECPRDDISITDDVLAELQDDIGHVRARVIRDAAKKGVHLQKNKVDREGVVSEDSKKGKVPTNKASAVGEVATTEVSCLEQDARVEATGDGYNAISVASKVEKIAPTTDAKAVVEDEAQLTQKLEETKLGD